MTHFKSIVFSLLVFLALPLSGQDVEKLIKEKRISRVIKTLSADEMMGRPAAQPERIEPAIAFIENEFKSIGLEFFQDLGSYRQIFNKIRIKDAEINLVLDGKKIDDHHIILMSEKGKVASKGGWKIHYIKPENNGTDLSRQFTQKFRTYSRDTASAIIIVDEAFIENFKLYKGIIRNRFTTGQPGTRIFVIGSSIPSTYSVDIHQKLENIRMSNLVGVLPGKSRPEELVIFSSHYDHIGILKSVEGDSIANGADDDASGTTAVIELARYFRKINNNERTLIFVAFTAEEIGGFGSQHFSNQLDIDKTIAMFNIEMIGKPSRFGINHAWITGYERSDFGTILQKNLDGTPFTFKPDPYPEQNLFYRSDNATLARLGVPAHSISTDQIDIDKRYHSVDDEFDSMDIQNLTSTIRAIALSSKSIISGKDTPKRINPATVR